MHRGRLKEGPGGFLLLKALGRPEVVMHSVALADTLRPRRDRHRLAQWQAAFLQQPVHHRRFADAGRTRHDDQGADSHAVVRGLAADGLATRANPPAAKRAYSTFCTSSRIFSRALLIST